MSILSPSTEMLPPVEVSTPVIRLKVVLLPAPFGPISATISPACTSKVTSLTATTPPNCLRALVDPQQHVGRAGGARARAATQARYRVACAPA